MKCKWIPIVLCLLSLLTFPFHLNAQQKDAGKIYKVAILPFLIHSQENLDYLREGINDILTSRITVEGRIVVIERTVVERILWEMRPMRLDEAVAKEVGARAAADYVVLGSITKIGNYISLDARLIPITEDKPPLAAFTQHKGIDDVMLKIGDFAQDIGFRITGRRVTAARPSDTRHPAFIQPGREIGRIGPEGPGYKKSQTFGFEIKGLDVADVDGDKKNEVIVMDQNNLYIFKYDGEKLSLFRKIEIGYQHNFLTLDVADVNRNGIAEIIITSVVDDNLQSFIIEYEQNEFKVITRKSGWFYRVLEHPKDGSILMGQNMGSDGLISGPIYRFVWKKNSFERGPKMPFPKETQVFGLAVGEVREQGKMDIFQVDQAGQFRMFASDGAFLWKGRGEFGGTNNFYETLKKRDDVYRAGSAPAWRVYIPGRIVLKDIDGDGLQEVVINKNLSTGLGVFDRMRSFSAGEIHNLLWEQNSLVPSWKTRELEGYIADYQVKDADNDGVADLVVAVVETHRSGAMGGKGASQILFFKLVQ
jgi:TolB-like protein